MNYSLNKLKGDLFGGLSASIVALPVVLAFGIQSGLGMEAGLYGAIFIGILAALLGGTPAQISGPTAPMTVVSTSVVATVVTAQGEANIDIVYSIFLLSGIFQILFGVLRVGKYIRFLPYPVISGFMSGTGVILVMKELFPAFGHPSPKKVFDIVTQLNYPIEHMNINAVILCFTTIAIIYLFPKVTKAVPSSLVAILVVSFIPFFIDMDAPRIGAIPEGFPKMKSTFLTPLLTGNFDAIKIPNLTFDGAFFLIAPAITLAVLGSIESLITSVIVDNTTKTKHKSSQELIGQGIGNAVLALFGGIPGAGATMRTLTNIRAGGKTRISGIIHGVILLLVLLVAGKFASHIPRAVLSGIVIAIGISIIDYKGIRHIRLIPKADGIVMFTVLLITVFGTLIQAVIVGLVLVAFLFIKQMSDLATKYTTISSVDSLEEETPWEDEKPMQEKLPDYIFVKHLYGPLFFGFTAEFQKLSQQLDPKVKILILRMDRVPYIDQTGLYAMEDVLLDLKKRGIEILCVGLKTQPKERLEGLGIIPELLPKHEIFNTFEDCISWLSKEVVEIEYKH